MVTGLHAQTVTNVQAPVVINGTGFAAGDTVTGCTNVVVVSPTAINANCPAGTTTVVVKSPCTAAPIGTWTNVAIGAHTANFEIQYDATVGTKPSDLIVALSNAQASSYGMTSTPVRFDGSGNVDAINAATYGALAIVPYLAGAPSHITVDVNLTNHTFSVFVGSTAIATNYAFRTVAGAPTSLNYLTLYNDVGTTASVCNLQVLPYPAAHSVTLRWLPSPVDATHDAPATYAIYKNAALLASVLASVTQFVDTTVTAGQAPCYAVAAVNAGGASIQVTPPSCLTVP